MKNQNRKWTVLGRQVVVFLLLATLLLGNIMPGGVVHATGADQDNATEPTVVVEADPGIEVEIDPVVEETEPLEPVVEEIQPLEPVVEETEPAVEPAVEADVTDVTSMLKDLFASEEAKGATYSSVGTFSISDTKKAPYETYWVEYGGKWCAKYASNDAWVYNAWVRYADGTYYFIDNEGYMLTGTHKVDGKTYNFGTNGAIKLDYGPVNGAGGSWLYYKDANIWGSSAKSLKDAYYRPYVHPDYAKIVLGQKPADYVTSSTMYDASQPVYPYVEDSDAYNVGLADCVDSDVCAVVSARYGVGGSYNASDRDHVDDYSKIANGKFYAVYHNIGTYNGKKVCLKLSLEDYALADQHTSIPRIGFSVKKGVDADGTVYVQENSPGVNVIGISWLSVKYSFMEHDGSNCNHGSGKAISVKGSTTYYDVDGHQGVQLDGGNKTIISTNDSVLSYNNPYSSPSTFVYYNGGTDDTKYSTTFAFTEEFEGSSFVRHYSFLNWHEGGVPATAGGGIYNTGVPIVPVAAPTSVTVKKNVVGGSTTEKFTFTASYTYEYLDVNGKTNTRTVNLGTFTLAHNQTKTFSEIPSGAKFTVKETAHPDYTQSHASQTITAAADAGKNLVTFTNTRKVGNLTVKKVVEGVSTTKKYSITVTGPNGFSQTFSLGHNETKTFTGIPVGTYTVKENTGTADAAITGYTWTKPGDQSASVPTGGTASVTVTNKYTRDLGNLTLKKVVTGITTGVNPEFTFTVKDANGKTHTVKLNKSNNYTATLKGLPTGTATITEATAPTVSGHTFAGVSNGVNSSYTRTVDITKNGTASVTYTNNYSRDRGNLTLKKNVEGITNGATPEFTFTVKDADGKTYTVKLNKGNNYTATLKDLPTGNTTITEATAPSVSNHDFVGVNNGVTASYTRTVSVTKGTTATVTYTNTYARQKGNVNITKTVDSPSSVDKNREYQFKAVLMDGNTKLWEETFTLKHGQTKSYKDLPTGAVLTVTETDYSADNIVTTVNNKSVTVGKGTTVTIAYTNTRKTGNADITKTVVSPSSVDTDRAYQFKAVLMDGNTKLWEETFTLKHGQTKSYKNLPTGAVLTVTETDYSGNFITTTVTNNGKATIGNGDTKKIAFTNTRDVSEVTLKKTVKGGVVDAQKEFEFTATLRDGGKFVAFKDGTTAKTFNLKHDETITFKDLPVGAELVIIEGDYEDYFTDNNSGDGVTATYVIKSGANDVIVFENTLKNSSVEVKKVIKNEVNPNKTFNFTATLDFAGKQVAFPASAEGEGITFSADRMTATFTLGNDESVVFEGLPVGTALKVVEEGSSDYATVNTDGTGVNAEKVVALEKTTITYTNTRKTGTVKVSKEVIGSTADDDVAFTFTAHLYDGDTQVAFPASVGNIAGVTLKDDNKTITFTLKHGESLSISGLYAGTTLKVVEAVPDNYIAQPESDETTVEPDKIKDIDITNLRKLADVDVKKIVAGHVIHDDVDFTFTATLWDGETQIAFPGETTVGAKTFTLKHNEIESFKDLYVGSTLKIVETENVNFTTENTHGEGFNATYTVKEMLNDTIVYTNTIKVGSVKVTKTVAGGIIDKDQEFEFTAQLFFRGQQITFPDGDETKTFTLKHGEEKIFTDLPIGTVLKAVETEHEFYITEYTGQDAEATEPVVTVVDTTEKTLAYTNTVKETELTITKTVTGNMGDRDKDFTFTVSMVDKYGNPVEFQYNNQTVTSATFTLKHDESVTLTGIPVGAIVTIDEENEDYEATATLNGEKLRISNKGEAEVTIEDTEADEVVVNNELTIPVPVGVVLDSLPYVVILAVVVAGGIFLFLRKRKIAED